MAMKEWFRRLQPVQLYLMLTLTVAFFITELIVSHVTHALTLLVDSYHMLCNIIALSGCIITIKYGRDNDDRASNFKGSVSSCVGEELTSKKSIDITPKSTSAAQEKQLKNTFGWARIDVIVMLICCVFLASLCFSLLVEAVQTLIHIDHHDEMHHPLPVLGIGLIGLLLNGICYLLIGGYTFHQGSFLYVTANGDVVLDKVVTNDSVKKGQRRLSRTRPVPTHHTTYNNRQGPREMLRDISGCIFVIITSLIGYFFEDSIAKYFDPVLSIISALVLLWLSYPYMKESGLILLQTIPDTINIDSLKTELIEAFPDILNVHDLHVWQLTATKVISTCHIIFHDPMVYANIRKDMIEFFISQGITQVTVQPEFSSNRIKKLPDWQPSIKACLMKCHGEDCLSLHCCATSEQALSDSEKHRKHSSRKNSEMHKSAPELKSVHVDSTGLQSLQSVKVVIPSDLKKETASSMPKLNNNLSVSLKNMNKLLKCNGEVKSATNRSMSMTNIYGKYIQNCIENEHVSFDLKKSVKHASMEELSMNVNDSNEKHDCESTKDSTNSNLKKSLSSNDIRSSENVEPDVRCSVV